MFRIIDQTSLASRAHASPLGAALYFASCFYLLASLAHAETPPTSVFAAKVAERPAAEVIEVIGTLKAEESIEVSSVVTERIISLPIESGQHVAKGEVLVQLDAREEIALRKEELARIAEAKRQTRRLRPLVANNTATEATLDQQTLVVSAAEARLAALDARIAQRKILAPFSGLVGLRNLSEGAIAQPGDILMTLDNTERMKFDFEVPERHLAVIEPGTSIELSSAAFTDRTFIARIANVNSRVDPVTRTITVRAFVDNSDGSLKPGMLMKAKIAAQERSGLFIPEEAVSQRGRELFVMRVVVGEQGLSDTTSARSDRKFSVERVAVETGQRQDGSVEITRGLSRGDVVVTHGSFKLSPQSKVTIRALQENRESLKELLSKERSQAQSLNAEASTL